MSKTANWREIKEWQEKEKTFLDTLDIQAIAEDLDTDNIYDIMEAIESKFQEKYLEEDFIFNWLDASEFKDYLEQRYPTANIYEQVETTYHVIF